MGYTFKQNRNRKYVYSKIIHFLEYDKESLMLKVGFNDGLIGYFKDVPVELYSEFESSNSKGSFFYKKLYKAGYKTRIVSV